jgi:hypothetical protein
MIPQEDAELAKKLRYLVFGSVAYEKADFKPNAIEITDNLMDKLLPFIKARDEQREREIEKVTRFEVIDHRECLWCRGRKVANYLQKDGSYKEQPCNKCEGSGIMGGRVYAVSSNAEASNIQIELSYQDDGKTLKVFVNDRKEGEA